MTRIIKPVLELGPAFEGWVSPAVRVGNLVFLAGLIGTDPGTGKVVQGTEAQIRRIFDNIDLVLRAHGSELQHVVRLTMYFTDRPRQWPILDRIRRELFPKDPPATTGVGITLLEQGAEVELEAIAIVPD
ncbi:MAG: RidA family protein [Xanthobacteraceae bacterium]|nr:RidA family protein [Xanthobacteraceae bacterium]